MKKLFSALCVMFLAVTLTGCGEESSSDIIQPMLYEESEGQTFDMENESLKFSLNGDSTTFTITDKRSGNVWNSNPTDIEAHGAAKGKYKDILNSTLLVQYSNSTDSKVDIDNYTKSIKNKNYAIEKVSDTEIKVTYTIGEVEKVFICPPAATESRMNEFLSRMDDSTQKTVKRQYTVYDASKMDSAELSEAKEMFPDVEKEPVYVLREDISDSYATQVEKAFMEAGYTEEDYKKDKESFELVSSNDKPVFTVVVHYVLDGDDFVVRVPMTEIQYNSSYPIVELSVLPYMGAGSVADNGFIIVPDGTGGIINFNNGKTGQQTYTSNMYGWDYGQYRKMVVDETKSNFPMFAIAKNNASFICASEEGSAYAIVRADISGKENGYNYGRYAYSMIHGENMDISSKSDTTVRVFEADLPEENITQRYIFSDSTNYTDMAGTYREYLMKHYPTLKKKEESSVSLTLEMVGAVDHMEHIVGYPVVRSQALSTYEEAKKMLEVLVNDGVKASDISAKYSGWYNTGVKATSSAQINLVGRLGSKSDMKDLAAYAKEQGIDLFMEGNFSYVYKDKLFDGFSQNRNAAKFCSREIAEIPQIYPVTFVEADGEDPYYLTKPSYSKECLEHFSEEIKALGTGNVAFADYGSMLGADYNPKDAVSREKAMQMEVESLKAMKENGNKVMVTDGNQYVVPYSDVITNMPISTQKINLIDESIPFYTIALHGLVDYTGDSINLAEDYEENLLKSVETGAGLYYIVMHAETSELQEGLYTKYYACNFEQWKDDIKQLYDKFNTELGDIYNQFIVKHQKLANGVYLTGYENGKNVIVNYNYNDYNYNGTVVPKRNFITEGGGQ